MFNEVHIGSVGIDYRGTPNQLGGCIADAHSWQQWAAPFAKRTLERLESDATFDGITDMVLDLFSGMKAGDLAVITRSGHGTQVPDRSGDEADGLDEAFVPYDYRQKLYLDDQYRTLLQRKPQGTYVLLIDDFCHSGTAARVFTQRPEECAGLNRFIPFHSLEAEMCPTAVNELCGPRARSRDAVDVDEGVIQFTGCLDTEVSYDANFPSTGPNGAFTYYLIRSYKQLQKLQTFGDWFKMLRSYLPSSKYQQTPQLNASDVLKGWYAPGLAPSAAPAPVPQPSPGAGVLSTFELLGRRFEIREIAK